MNWFGIFGDPERRRLQREADRLWARHCQWNGTTAREVGFHWLAPDPHFSKLTRSPFAHPSAHAKLGRYALVEHWIPKLAKQAVHEANVFGVVESWAQLEHLAFWQELARVFAIEEAKNEQWSAPWQLALHTASACGNLAPFVCSPRREVERYCHDVSATNHPHPRIGLWLVEQGALTLDALRDLVDERTFPMVKDARQPFAGNGYNEPFSPEYVAQWCQLYLKEYGLTTEQKVRLVGQTIYVFGQECWTEHLKPACLPYLADVDLELLYNVLGTSTNASLGRTVHALSVALPGRMAIHQVTEVSLEDVRDPHAHLLMMQALTPANDRVQLYFLACMAKNAELGLLEQPTMLNLPDLG